MYVFRETLNCKPGKVRPMVEKIKIISKAFRELSQLSVRVYTDVSGEPYWTLVAEIEVKKIEDFFAIEEKVMTNADVRAAMADYHDLVVGGRREIFKIEQ